MQSTNKLKQINPFVTETLIPKDCYLTKPGSQVQKESVSEV